MSPIADFVAGGIAGVALCVVTHPFDTAKVLLQQGRFASAIHCATAVTKHSVREHVAA